MSERRQMWETLATQLRRLEQADRAELAGLEQEMRRLAKAQFKANAVVEELVAHLKSPETANKLPGGQPAGGEAALVEQQAAAARHPVLAAIFPALDGVENAIASGRRYLRLRDLAAKTPNPTPAQAALISPADRATLAGWLEGLRLVRDRLLAVLEAGGVTPIPTVGHRFDPYLHMAVGVTAQGEGPEGIIVAEERRGYRSAAGVLRYADVIVFKAQPED